jgi:hypothetical protein
VGDHRFGFQKNYAFGIKKIAACGSSYGDRGSNVGAAAGCDILILRFIRQPAHPRANLAKMPAFSPTPPEPP